MLEICDKNKISKLTFNDKNQWFDVLNYKLEEDRGISFLDPLIKEKQKQIKKDYLNFLENCAIADDFHKYYIKRQEGKIISLCRIAIYLDKYVLEGLETHKDHYRKGFATALTKEIIFDLKKDGISTLYSEARSWNVASNKLQQKMGFVKYAEDLENNFYKIDVDRYVTRK